jgi:serine/threonine protein kinase
MQKFLENRKTGGDRLPFIKNSIAFSGVDRGGGLKEIANARIKWRYLQIMSWLSEKRRFISQLNENADFRKALFSPILVPFEGARYRSGECIFEYLTDGRVRRYKVCGIQSGGLSNVYTVIDLDEMKPYCLKENRSTFGNPQKKDERLKFEAELCAKLGPHPNLVELRSVFSHRNRTCVVYEFVPGRSLNHYLRGMPLDPREAIRYSLELCRAMKFACQKLPGFVHGDIKPGNCLISEHGTLKLADFGLSAIEDFENAARKNTGTDHGGGRNYGGTDAYMAPELFQSGPVNRQLADVYAFGITFFEMLTGDRPFRSRSSLEAGPEASEFTLPEEKLDKSGISTSLIKLIKSCLSENPSMRPGCFCEIEAELHRITGVETGLELPEIERLAAVSPKSAASLSKFVKPMGDNEVQAIENRFEINEIAPVVQTSEQAMVSGGMTQEKPGLADSFTWNFRKAKLLVSNGKYREAEPFVSKALSLYPENITALNLAGEICFNLGQAREAEIFLERAIKLDKWQSESYYLLCRSYLSFGRLEKAHEIAGRALACGIDNSFFFSLRGEYFKGTEQFAKAAASYKRALLEENGQVTRKKFTDACFMLDDEEESGSGLVTQHRKMLFEGARLLGNISGSSIPSTFIKNFFKLPVDRKSTGLIIFALDDVLIAGLSRGSEKTCADICTYLLKVLENIAIHELAFDIYYPIGKILYFLGRFEECEKVFRQSLKQTGASENAFYYLGACRELSGDFRSALKFYKKAQRLNPNCELNFTGVNRAASQIKRKKIVSRIFFKT